MSDIDWAQIAQIGIPIVVTCWALAYGYVKKRAADPIIDKYDTILKAMEAAAPILAIAEDWADKRSNSVPPTPSNPDGTAA